MKSKDGPNNPITNGSVEQPSPPSLYQILKNADLLQYSDNLRNVLKLRHAGDLAYTEEKDLTDIGMSRPEQKRLRREYDRLCVQSSFVVRLRKVFGRTDNRQSVDEMNDSVCDLPEEAQGQHIIPYESVDLCRELGRGEFGICYQGTWNLPHGDSIQVAIKRVPPEKLRSNPTYVLQEAAIMTRMRHDNVIRLYGIVLDTKSIMLVSELAPYGSLLECLRKPAWDEPFTVDTLCKFARQIACGMQYLTSHRLVHRDLAARNILVASLTKVKISDFGLSRCLGVGEDYYRSEFSPTTKLPIAWCAPEAINMLKFTPASDVYAYGVTLWEIFSYGKMPWSNLSGPQILHNVDTQRKMLDCPAACPSQLFELMKECWNHDPEKRPEFEKIAQVIQDSMPQVLIAVSDCHNDEENRLQFDKGETIILLDKCRNVSPENGNFWYGATKNGRTGLFKPAETVAYLGAENPTSNKLQPPTPTIKCRTTVGKKLSKNDVISKEKRKLLISEPQNDLRHTCHVGVDGKVFGLIHVGKGDLSPLIGLSDPATMSNAKNGALNALSKRPAVPQRIPPTPIRPPRTPHYSSNQKLQPSVVHRTQSLPRTTDDNTTVTSSCSTSIGFLSNSIKMTKSDEFRIENSGMKTFIPDKRRSFDDSTQLLDEVLTSLQREITDFSISTAGNDSDTRPLLASPAIFDGESKTVSKHFLQDTVLPLTEQESKRLDKRMSDEHRKAARSLIKIQRSSNDKFKPEEVVVEKVNCGNYTAKLNAASIDKSKTINSTGDKEEKCESWSEEAQAAYKLLVQCGDFLKRTSPVESRQGPAPYPVSTSELHSPISVTSSITSTPPPRPPKRTKFPSLVLPTNDDTPMVERPETDNPLRHIRTSTFDSQTNNTDVNQIAPKLPPKPRQFLSTSLDKPPLLPPNMAAPVPFFTFAPTVQRAAMLPDEIVKF